MGNAFDPEQWRDFYVMLGGAAAALVGLIFVSASLQLHAILTHPWHRGRAAASLLSLASLVLLAVFVLVPQPSLRLLAVEVIVVALASPVYSARGFWHAPSSGRFRSRVELAVGVVGSALAVAAGVSLLLEKGPGLGLLVPGVVLALVFGVWNAWRLMVDLAAGDAPPRAPDRRPSP